MANAACVGYQTDGDGLEPVAIIGMACRFPGEASTVSDFWNMIVAGRSANSKIPADRFTVDSYYHPSLERRGGINTTRGYFLKEDVSLFDPTFFAMTVDEAQGMDPMHRLNLELVYEALENAGIVMDDVAGSDFSVFHGCFTGDYSRLSNADIYDSGPYEATGNGLTMLSNRVSWFFDMRGPSLTVDTACSSSLYALHLACQTLRQGESKTAVVSGSNLVLNPDMMHSLTALHFLSPDGVCHSFDERANGYARGEAFGALILKPLKAALADGDTIRAVIRGTGANQDGRTPGITNPSSEAQAALIMSTYRKAKLSLADTGYFEAHGTGTAIGDPKELTALEETFGKGRISNPNPLYIASVKTNIGHTEGCSGLAGVLKAVLCLERGLIAPNHGLGKLNPKIGAQEWNREFPKTLTPWPSSGLRRASVNSFGYGGANAHVILDDAYHYLKLHNLQGNHSTLPDKDESYLVRRLLDPGRNNNSAAILSNGSHVNDSSELIEEDLVPRQRLFVFSSHDSGFQRMVKPYSKYLKMHLTESDGPHALKEPDMKNLQENLVYTLANKRTFFNGRSFVVADTLQKLSESLENGLPKVKRTMRDGKTVWVFTGQGAQWPGMGKDLLKYEVFKASLLKTHDYLARLGCPWNVIDELSQEEGSKVDSPEYAQPLCTALQIALVDLMYHWGMSPYAVVGHSSGEIGAAYAARALSHENCVKIAYQRGVYSLDVSQRRKGAVKGSMCAVGLSETEVEPFLAKLRPGSVVIACYNSPSSLTLSGDSDSIDEIETMLKDNKIFARKLRVPTAYHSHHMGSVSGDYLQAMGVVCPLPVSADPVKIYSSVTGDLIDFSALNTSYWVSNLLSPVKFAQACTKLFASDRYEAMIELGPHEGLRGPLSQIVGSIDVKMVPRVPYTSLLLRGQDCEITALSAAGRLWSQGFSVDLNKVNAQEGAKKYKTLLNLPPYSWNHSRSLWHEPAAGKKKRFPKYARTDLLGIGIDNQISQEPRWRNFLTVTENPWLDDHKIQGARLFPGAGMLIMAIEACLQIADSERKEKSVKGLDGEHKEKTVKGLKLRDIKFENGLVIPDGSKGVEAGLNLRVHKSNGAESWYHFTVYSRSSDTTWIEHSSGLITVVFEEDSNDPDANAEAIEYWKQETATFNEICAKGTKAVDSPAFYEHLASIGMGYGPLFANVVDAFGAPGTLSGYGSIVIPDTESVMPQKYEFPHLIHPTTLDAIFHLLFVGFTEGGSLKEAIVPVSAESIYISANIPKGAGSIFKGFSATTRKGIRESAGRIVVSDKDWSEPKIVIENFAAREVSSGISASQNAKSKKICGQIHWKEDVDHLKGEAVFEVMRKASDCDSLLQVAAWLEHLCFKDANLDVLIVEGLTDDVVEHVLDLFGPAEGRRFCFSTCTVTRSSDAELKAAKESFRKNNYSIIFKKLDFAKPAAEQEFENDSFDLIISGTEPLPEANGSLNLATLRGLLKRGGHLVLTGPEAKHEEDWRHELTSSGFDELKGYMRNTGRSDSSHSAVVISSMSAPKQDVSKDHDTVKKEVLLLKVTKTSYELLALERNLTEKLKAEGYNVRTTLITEQVELKDATIISLIEVENPWVIHWTADDLANFHKLVYSAGYVLWLTRGGQMVDSDGEGVQFSPSVGLLRTIRTEVPQIKLPHLDLSPTISLTAEDTTTLIMNTFKCTFSPTVEVPDLELAERNGLLLIPRLAADQSFDRELQGDKGAVVTQYGNLHPFDRPLRLKLGVHAYFNNIYWSDDEEALLDLDPEEVEIKTTVMGLNQVDLEAATGHPQITTIGREVGGVISKIGSNVKGFHIGQRVVALKDAACRTQVRQHQSLVQVVPENMSVKEAAATVLAGTTAYYAIYELARVEPGDTVLIHAAAGAVGQTALQLAQHIGAEIYVTVGSDAKKTLLMEHFNIPDDHIFNSRGIAFAKGLMRVTNGKGVDVAISSATGEALRQTWLCMADFGRYVNIGLKTDAPELAQDPLRRNVTYQMVNMGHMEKGKPAKLSIIMQKTFALIRAGVVKSPYPVTTFAPSDLEKVLKQMQVGNHSGKLMLDFQANQSVLVEPRNSQPLSLDPEAAYVLSGGFGGLGVSLAETMIQAGARRIVFLSRSGGRSEIAQKVLEKLGKCGCEAVAFACDISDGAAVEAAMEDIESRGWVVKGAIQLAMVLRDSTFDNMDFEKWSQATRPKIQGTWNLHQFLPKDMDFFILMSSVVGIIGNAGQANYIAGNTFMDSLAHYRRSIGLTATSLDVGVVSDSGHFTDDEDFKGFLGKFPHLEPLQTTTSDLMLVLSTLMKGKTADEVHAPAQLIMGINDKLQREGNITSLWALDRKFDHRLAAIDRNGANGNKDKLSAVLAATESLEVAGAIIEEAMKTNLATATAQSVEEIDSELSLKSYGMDSLKAVEVRNWCFREIKADVSVFDILAETPLSKLAIKIATLSTFVPEAVRKNGKTEEA